jgi:quinol monooxygenase YgiN
VEFTLKPSASRAECKKLLVENANASLRMEPGCHQFDVVEFPDATNLFVLYEIYEDEEAFKVHLNTQHYQDFSLAADQFFEDKKILLGEMASSRDNFMGKSDNA